jgi:hypothetical protein
MIHRNLAIALTAAGSYIAVALALSVAERTGFLAHDTAARALQVFTGLALAVYANFLPKRLGSFRNPAAAMCMESVLRVSGWAYTLGGLAFAITSLLPLPDAVPTVLLGTATAYVLGYTIWAFMERTPKPHGPA